MIPGNLYSGIEWILLGLVNSGHHRGTAAVVKKSLSFKMLTELETVAWHVPRPPPRTVRLLGPESAWGCSRSDGLGLRIPKLVLKVRFRLLGPVLAPGED